MSEDGVFKEGIPKEEMVGTRYLRTEDAVASTTQSCSL